MRKARIRRCSVITTIAVTTIAVTTIAVTIIAVTTVPAIAVPAIAVIVIVTVTVIVPAVAIAVITTDTVMIVAIVIINAVIIPGVVFTFIVALIVALNAVVTVIAVARVDEVAVGAAHRNPRRGIIPRLNHLGLAFQNGTRRGIIHHFQLFTATNGLNLGLGQAGLHLNPGEPLRLKIGDQSIGIDRSRGHAGAKQQDGGR